MPASKGRFAPWGTAVPLPPQPVVTPEGGRFPLPFNLPLPATVHLAAGGAPLRSGCVMLAETRTGGEQAAMLPHAALIPTLTLWR
ncbi:MAG: hypothetical protein H8E90_01820 [Anaerolineales bacterium]|nr:hypothetical protein [Anaerolineales bacterium]